MNRNYVLAGILPVKIECIHCSYTWLVVCYAQCEIVKCPSCQLVTAIVETDKSVLDKQMECKNE